MANRTVSSSNRAAKRTQRAERRIWVRYPCDLEVACKPVGDANDVGWWATVRDLSAGGIGFVLDRHFPAGEALFVDLPNPLRGKLETVPARVAHSTQLPDGQWLTGCEFVTPLTRAEVRALVRDPSEKGV